VHVSQVGNPWSTLSQFSSLLFISFPSLLRISDTGTFNELFLSKFIPRFNTIVDCKPFITLLNNGGGVNWMAPSSSSFSAMKSCLLQQFWMVALGILIQAFSIVCTASSTWMIVETVCTASWLFPSSIASMRSHTVGGGPHAVFGKYTATPTYCACGETNSVDDNLICKLRGYTLIWHN